MIFNKKIDRNKIKTWFITGCSSGFGKEFCIELLYRGYNVIASARRLADLDNLKEYGTDENLLCLQLDITNSAQITECVSGVKGWDINVLVNNAGIMHFGGLLTSKMDDFRSLFETNVFGTVELTKMLLPTLRKNGATIVNISSVVGASPFPQTCAYSMSKYALEGLTANISGVRTLSVLPGCFKTMINEKATSASGNKHKAIGEDPIIVIKAVIDTVEKKKMPLRLVVGADAKERLKIYENILKRNTIYV